MKNSYFSLIVLFLFLPFFVSGEDLSQDQNLLNYIQNTPSEPSTTPLNPEITNIFFPNTQTTTQFPQREGEPTADYINRITIENSRRQANNEELLPGPTISTTQIQKNNGSNIAQLDGTRPSMEMLQNTSILPVTTGQNQGFGGSEGAMFNKGISGILNQIFYAGLIIAVVLAIVMIVRGGLEYMTIDAASNKESAKNRIRAAIGGLVLCFSTIIILNTINPNLTNLSINFEKITNLSEIDVQGGAGIESGARGDGEYVAGTPTGGTGTNAVVKGNFSHITTADLRPHLGSGYSDTDVQAFIDAGRQYNIDPRFLASISKFETGNGTSKAFTDGRNNAMGTSNSVGPIGFNSVRDSIFTQTSNLVKEGGFYRNANTIQQIGDIYSPSINPATSKPYANDINATNHSWARSVGSTYSQMTGGGN